MSQTEDVKHTYTFFHPDGKEALVPAGYATMFADQVGVLYFVLGWNARRLCKADSILRVRQTVTYNPSWGLPTQESWLLDFSEQDDMAIWREIQRRSAP